jgi:hypothetical protein
MAGGSLIVDPNTAIHIKKIFFLGRKRGGGVGKKILKRSKKKRRKVGKIY